MKKEILKINNIKIKYNSLNRQVDAIKGVDIELHKGESIGIVGESGSGKTSLSLAILGLLPKNSICEGSVIYNSQDILRLGEEKYNEIRFNKIALVFQNSRDVLNPLITIGEQIGEVIKKHLKLEKNIVNSRVEELLKNVGLEKSVKNLYPNQISGGMRQKALIAMAISCDPEILILDEPTSSLDMISKGEIINLLNKIRQNNNLSMIVISHELDTIKALTDKMYVMYKGLFLEKGPTDEVLLEPHHMYTKGLIHSSPSVKPYGDLWGIPRGEEEVKSTGCQFYNRCNQRTEKCLLNLPTLMSTGKDREVMCNRGGIVTLLEGKKLFKTYRTKNGEAIGCMDCDIEVKCGEIVGLIGASGSGKTTLAGLLTGLLDLDKGIVEFENKKIDKNNFTKIENGIQLVFQDPYTSINENFTVFQAISEPIRLITKKETKKSIREKVIEILKVVQLDTSEEFMNARCYSLSGGQLQRIALGRSLSVSPKLLIADEITSMLDPSTKANILRLLKSLQNEKGFSVIYITHDLAVARKISDRIYVMKDGKIIENGPTEKIFNNPDNEYTTDLITKCV